MSISLTQILALVGKLDDAPGDDTPRERFRKYLADNVTEVGEIRDYIGECLLKSGEPYYRALQDLVNHIGRFLGFTVTFGRPGPESIPLSTSSQGFLALRWSNPAP